MAIRYDRYAIKAEKTDEGFIRDAPVIGRVGILKYRNPDGSTRYEYRPPDEAFNADSLATLKGKPITVGHHGMVSDKTWNRSLPVGTVMSEGRQDGDNIRADMVIYNFVERGGKNGASFNYGRGHNSNKPCNSSNQSHHSDTTLQGF